MDDFLKEQIVQFIRDNGVTCLIKAIAEILEEYNN